MTKVAIVTGGSRGIGKAISQQLAKDGFYVVVNFSGNQTAADETVKEIKNDGGQAIALKGDVSSLPDMEKVFAEAKKLGSLEVVVNSAGVMKNSPIADLKLEEFDNIIQINLRGTFIVLGLAAKNVASGGRIISLSTSVIALSAPNYGSYIASKLGVEGLSRVLANELRGKNITVNIVAPGPVGTDLFYAGKSPELIEKMRKLPPLERLGEPEDISKVVSFIASPDGYWVNNQVVRVNGGYA